MSLSKGKEAREAREVREGKGIRGSSLWGRDWEGGKGNFGVGVGVGVGKFGNDGS